MSNAVLWWRFHNSMVLAQLISRIAVLYQHAWSKFLRHIYTGNDSSAGQSELHSCSRTTTCYDMSVYSHPLLAVFIAWNK